MTLWTPNLHASKTLISLKRNKISRNGMKTPLRLVWKCCFNAFKIGSKIFRRRGTLKRFQCLLTISKNRKQEIACAAVA